MVEYLCSFPTFLFSFFLFSLRSGRGAHRGSAFLDVVDLSEVLIGQGRVEIHLGKVNASELK